MRLALGLAFGSCLLASSTFAQKPTIVPEAITEANRLLNIAEVTADARIQLAWHATYQVVTGLEFYEYQLTYETHRSDENRDAQLVRIEEVDFGGEAEDRQGNGERIVVYMRPSEILPVAGLVENGGQDDASQNIVLKVYDRSNEFDQLRYETYVWTFRYDTRAPGRPTAQPDVLEGENRLELRWVAPTISTDVDSYSILYCPDVRGLVVDTSSTSSTAGTLPCTDPIERTNIDPTFGSFSVEKGLQVGVPAALSVRAVDEFGNIGVLSNVVIGTPRLVSDFWEHYKANGGGEDGGFCFIATAAYGSYAHPTVKIFRWFRDAVLLPTAPGRAFVAAYYEHSPAYAAKVAADEDLARVVRVGLVMFVFVMVVSVGVLGILVVLLLSRVARRFARLAPVSLVLLLLPLTAEARRPDSSIEAFGIGFEFKGGPYLPDIGHDGGGTEANPAFNEIYGSNPNELFTLGFEVQLYRGIGTAGVGTSFGFMQFVGRGIPTEARDTTVFNIAPFTLTGMYRFDWVADQIPFPFVPYVKGGLAYYLWWVTTGTGDVARVEAAGTGADDKVGRGGKWGLTGTIGVSLLLNVIEPTSAQSLFATTGVRGTYLFGELTASKVDGFGSDGFDLSDATWNIGLFIEM